MRVKKYKIKLIEIRFHGNIKYFSVAIADYQIGSPDMPTLIISFYDENEVKKFEVKALMLDEDYANWGTNDSVIINYVCNILNLTLDN